MTTKDKAKELFLNYCKQIGSNCEHDSYCPDADCKLDGIVFCKADQSTAKQCALIAVDEIINECNRFYEAISLDRADYWEQVKTEIENI